MSHGWIRPGDVPRDPGLQPERTVLAWRRTGLAAAVTFLLVVRAVLLRVDPFGDTTLGPAGTVLAWVALGVAAAGGVLLATSAFLRGPDVGTLATAAGSVLLIAGATVVVVVDLLGL